MVGQCWSLTPSSPSSPFTPSLPLSPRHFPHLPFPSLSSLFPPPPPRALPGDTVSWGTCLAACNDNALCKQVVYANYEDKEEYTEHNGGATGRCLSTGVPTSPGADYYLADSSYKEYARRLVGTFPSGVGVYECMHWCRELYDTWGCR